MYDKAWDIFCNACFYAENQIEPIWFLTEGNRSNLRVVYTLHQIDWNNSVTVRQLWPSAHTRSKITRDLCRNRISIKIPHQNREKCGRTHWELCGSRRFRYYPSLRTNPAETPFQSFKLLILDSEKKNNISFAMTYTGSGVFNVRSSTLMFLLYGG